MSGLEIGLWLMTGHLAFWSGYTCAAALRDISSSYRWKYFLWAVSIAEAVFAVGCGRMALTVHAIRLALQ